MDSDHLRKMVDDAMNGAMLNTPYTCGFDPEDEDPMRKEEIDRVRSNMLRSLFGGDAFEDFLTQTAEACLQAELSARWDNGDALTGDDVRQLNHLFTHVTEDLARRLNAQAINPFVLALLAEGKYLRNRAHPEADFFVVRDAPTEP